LILNGCKKAVEQESNQPNKKRERIQNNLGDVVSAVFGFEDSSIAYEWKYEWAEIRKSNLLIRNFWKNPIDSQRVSSGNHIYIAIYDKFRVPPAEADSEFIEEHFGKIAGEDVKRKIIRNTDSTSRFEFPLRVRHRYVYINEDLLNKPKFELASLPKKYVSKYCRSSISKPVFNFDSTECLVHMQTSCKEKGAVYFLKRTSGTWSVVSRANATYPFIWYCG
jgi:hypothetical protein